MRIKQSGNGLPSKPDYIAGLAVDTGNYPGIQFGGGAQIMLSPSQAAIFQGARVTRSTRSTAMKDHRTLTGAMAQNEFFSVRQGSMSFKNVKNS